MRRLTAPICAAFAMLAMSAPLALAGPGGGGGGGGGGPGGAAGGFGGNSASHVGSQGITNSNGANSTDRDLGTNRAGDVMSTQGATHNQIPSGVGLPTPPAGSGH